MHSIRRVEDDRWAVIDADDVTVFVGTLRECEDWLDRDENIHRPQRSWFRRLFGGILRVFRGGSKSTTAGSDSVEETVEERQQPGRSPSPESDETANSPQPDRTERTEDQPPSGGELGDRGKGENHATRALIPGLASCILESAMSSPGRWDGVFPTAMPVWSFA